MLFRSIFSDLYSRASLPHRNVQAVCGTLLSLIWMAKLGLHPLFSPFLPSSRPAGWSGSGGLGAKEQGIQDPIKGGDVRDKWDQYKGVGVSLDDPYENYRRNKSYNFVARMKAREEGTAPALF